MSEGPFKSPGNELSATQRVGGGRYVLLKQLGRGGMGIVWLAQDERLGEKVALKFLPAEINSDLSALDDLRRETLRSRKLTHPNIIRIHDLYEAPGEPAFISMEYVDGPNLIDLRVQRGERVLPWTELKPLVQQLCDALDYAHGERVIHRDLKPANMMLDAKGRLKLADFGIAATISDATSRVSLKHASSGTLAYMSPQQMDGEKPKIADDIYALGATLYELLTSRPPFFSGDVAYQARNLPPKPMDERLAEFEIENEIPSDVAALITACLAKNPEQRPQSARAVAEWIGLDLGSSKSLKGKSLFADENAFKAGASQDSGTSSRSDGAGRVRKNVASLGKIVAAATVGMMGIVAALWLAFSFHTHHGANKPPVESASPPKAATVSLAQPDLQIPTNGLVLHFDFDEPPENGIVRDVSGNGNDGHVVGAQWTTEGEHGGGIMFGASDSYIRVPNNASLNPTNITLSVWIKTSRSSETWRRILDKNWKTDFALSIGGGFVPRQDHHGKAEWEVNTENNPATSGEVGSDAPVNDGRWHHLVGIYDGVEQRFYVDGQLQRRIRKWRGVLPSNSFDLTLGMNLSNPNPQYGEVNTSFDGEMDDVMIFNRALSTAEVWKLYESANASVVSGSSSDQSQTNLAKFNYGLGLDFGLGTFATPGERGVISPERFAPPNDMDVSAWVRGVKEAGMTYAVFSAKLDSGFCLWSTKDHDCDISQSPVKIDILQKFIAACDLDGIAPGVHYAIADLHREGAFRYNGPVSESYFNVIKEHITELHTKYPGLRVQIFDTSQRLSAAQWDELCGIIHRLNPECVILDHEHDPRFVLATVNRGMRWSPNAKLTPTQQLLGAYEQAHAAGESFLLNVGVDSSGRIPDNYKAVLMEMKTLTGH